MFPLRHLRLRVLEALGAPRQAIPVRARSCGRCGCRTTPCRSTRHSARDSGRAAPLRSAVAPRRERCSGWNGTMAATWEAWVTCCRLASSCIAIRARRRPRCSPRAGATKGTRAIASFSSCSPNPAGAISGSKWPAARRGPRAIAVRRATLLVEMFVNLFEVTGAEDTVRDQLDPEDVDRCRRNGARSATSDRRRAGGSTPPCGAGRSRLRRNPDSAPRPFAGPLVFHVALHLSVSKVPVNTPYTVVPSATTVIVNATWLSFTVPSRLDLP